MRSDRRLSLAGAVVLSALVSACAAVPPADEVQRERAPLYHQRYDYLSRIDDWFLEGRLAISDANDGGSGQLRWRQQAQGSRMDFHGALGRGAWRLETDERGAELAFADGRVSRADSVDDLVRTEVGWRVPVESLAWWIRGLAAPGRYQRRSLDDEGRLTELSQDGWTIDFERYGEVGEVTMPMRMTARQDDRTVKLAIRRWQLARQDAAD